MSNTPNRVGDVIIFNLTSLQPISVIEAHKSTIASMAFSNNGLYLATASDKGTIVRILKLRQGPNFTNSEEVPIHQNLFASI